MFNAILGWTNSATYGSVISYNLYWLVVMIGFISMRYQEVKGHWPLMKPKMVVEPDSQGHLSESESSAVEANKPTSAEKVVQAHA